MSASTSSALEYFLIFPKTSAALFLSSMKIRNSSITFISRSHLNPPKPRRRRSMSRAHHLLRLPFAAMRSPPEHPFVARANRIHRIPEFRSNPAVGGVSQHASALAIFNFPSNLAAELEVVTFVINRPGTIGLHVDPLVGGSNKLLACQRLLPRQNADIGHSDNWQPVPSLSAQCSSRAIGANAMSSLARCQISGEQSVSNDWRALRRNT